MKLTIGQKILFGHGLPMLCMTITGIASWRRTEQQLEANGWVRHTFLVMASAEDIRANLLEIESAARGYVVTADDRFLETIESFRARLIDSRKLLRTLTVDNFAQQRRIDVLDPAIQHRLADLVHISNMRKEKGLQETLEVIQQGNGRDRMAEIRDLLAAMENEERTLLNQREQTAQIGKQGADRIIRYGNVLGLTVAAFLGIATLLSSARPFGGAGSPSGRNGSYSRPLRIR